MNKSAIAIHPRVGNACGNWIHTARKLFAGSTILRRGRERAFANLRSREATIEILMPWTELMLTAFAIECLIKAIWIKQGHQLAQNGKYVPMIKNERHQLVPLCRAAGIALDRREADVLGRISDIAGSIGRYPIARRASQRKRACSWSSATTASLRISF